MPILHNMKESGNSYKVRLLAHQIGLPLMLEEYPPRSPKTKTPQFLAKNPNGRVPLLELEDGRLLAESNAILWFLSEGTQYQPADKWGRAEALQWMFFEQYSHEPYVAVARYWTRYAPAEERAGKRAHVAELMEKGNAALAVMETRLKTRDWFAGNRYSVADIALYAYTHAADEGGYDLARYPAILAWLARVAAQPRHIPL